MNTGLMLFEMERQRRHIQSQIDNNTYFMNNALRANDEFKKKNGKDCPYYIGQAELYKHQIKILEHKLRLYGG